jgi:hypothetical protein
VKKLRRRGQETQAQARREALGERALVDPRAAFDAGAHRAAVAGVEHQIAVGVVLEQRHAGHAASASAARSAAV